MRVALVLVMFAGLALATAHAGVVTVPCSRDNTLFQDAEGDTSNGAGPALFAGRNSQGLARRALARFDLAGALPPGVSIDDAVLQLEATSAPDAVARAITLHRLLADWGEGTSSSSGGGGAPATPGDATWIHALYSDQLWGQPGGDFEPAPSAATLVGDVDTYTWTGAGLRADVERWLADPAANFGWLLLGDETTARTVRRFDSREGAVPAFRPVLILFHSEPVPSRPTSWGRVKALFR